MTEKDLIKQLNSLKAIKMDARVKSEILVLLKTKAAAHHGESKKEFGIWNLLVSPFSQEMAGEFGILHGWLFRPVPRVALAGFLVLLTAGSLLFSVFILGNDFYDEPSVIISHYRYRENEETGLVNEEVNKEIGKSSEISPLSVVKQCPKCHSELDSVSQMTYLKEIKEPKKEMLKQVQHDNNQGKAYTSIQSEEEFLANFRISLLERINRIWVVSLELGNKEVFAVAQEAEKFYQNGDYDAALRAIMAAENLLK